jgi:hypothetical protein
MWNPRLCEFGGGQQQSRGRARIRRTPNSTRLQGEDRMKIELLRLDDLGSSVKCAVNSML